MTARPVLLALAPLLAACAYEPLEHAADLLARGDEPTYQFAPGGGIVSSSCLAGRPSGYGRLPPGCALDNAFAVQVARSTDLVAPAQPGPPYAAPAAAAAYDYLYGPVGSEGDTILTVGGTPGGAAGGAGRLDIPGDAAEPAGATRPEVLGPLEP